MTKKIGKVFSRFFSHRKINIFWSGFFYELENTSTVYKKYVGHRIGPTTPPSWPSSNHVYCARRERAIAPGERVNSQLMGSILLKCKFQPDLYVFIWWSVTRCIVRIWVIWKSSICSQFMSANDRCCWVMGTPQAPSTETSLK